MTRPKFLLGTLALIAVLGGNTMPVAAECPPIVESEKAWGEEYPKIHPTMVLKEGVVDWAATSVGSVLDSRRRLHILTGNTYHRHRYDRREGAGFIAGNPYDGVRYGVGRSPRLVLGTDDLPRGVFIPGIPETSPNVMVAVLGEDPATWAASRTLLRAPSHPKGESEEVIEVAAASGPDGKIHVAWTHNDDYDPSPEFGDEYVIGRIYYARLDQGAPGQPPGKELVEQVYESLQVPGGNDVVAAIDLKLDAASGTLHVLAGEDLGGPYPTGQQAIYFRKPPGGGWSDKEVAMPTVNAAIDTARMALKSDGTPVALLERATFPQILYYTERSAGWGAEIVEAQGGRHPELSLDSRDRARIVYQESQAPFRTFLRRREGPGDFGNRVDLKLGQISFNFHSLARAPDDGLWITDSFYPSFGYPEETVFATYVHEDNLGAQDALARVGDGRGAALNAANGNQHVSIPLFGTRGKGFATALALHYNGLEQEGDIGLSPGWRHSLQVYLTEARELFPYGDPRDPPFRKQLVLNQGDGAKVVFDGQPPEDNPILYLAQEQYGEFSRIDKGGFIGRVPYAFVMTDKSGVKYGFGAPTLKLARIQDPNGNRLDIVNAADSTTVTDTAGRATVIALDADRQVRTITYAPTGRGFTLAYDPTTKKLASVTDSAVPGEVWAFEYHTANDPVLHTRKGLLSKVIPPKGDLHAWEYFYQTDNRVVCAGDPDGNHLTVEYDDGDPDACKAKVRDRRANAFPAPDDDTLITCDFRRSLATRIDLPLTGSDGGVRKSVMRTFDQYRNELTFTDARGNTTLKTYAAVAVPAYVKDNLESVQRPGNDAAHRLEMTYTMDGLNRVATVKAERKAVHPSTGLEEDVVTRMTYDLAGNLLTRTFPYPSGGSPPTETYTYLPDGRIDTHTAPEGNLTGYRYGGLGDPFNTGLVTRIVLPNGLPETHAYDARGNRTSYTSMAGGTYTYGFDLRDRQTSFQEPGTPASLMAYDLHDLLETRTDPKGNVTTFTYDLQDRLEEERNALWPSGPPNLNRVKLTYDPNGNVLAGTDLKDQVTTLAYDARNRPERETSPDPGTGDLPLEARYRYDGDGNVVELTREGGSQPDQVTTMQYDGRNNLTHIIHPPADDLEAPPTGTPTPVPDAVHVDRTDYDASDLPVLRRRSANDAFKAASGTIHDFRALPWKTRAYRTDPDVPDPSFIQSVRTYDANTNLLTSTDPDERTWTFGYDSLDRPETATDAKGVIVSRTLYDDRANTVEGLIQDPANPGTLIRSLKKRFNLKGELDTALDVFNHPTGYDYDDNGNLIRTVDAEGNAVEREHDALDRLFKTTTHPSPGKSHVTRYVLDENGNRKEVHDPNQAVWKTDFDALDRPFKRTNPTLTFRTLSYDPFGNLRQSIDEGGQARTMAYDALDRPTSETITGGAGGEQTLLYFHDGADRRTQEVASLGLGSASLHRFDALSRQTAQEDLILAGNVLTPFRTIAYDYSPAGDRLSAASDDPGIGAWSYQHDEDHLLESITHSPSGEVHQWAYDEGMRQKTHTMPNGCVETRSYDSKERLLQLVTKTSGGAVLSDIGYTFDRVDNRKSLIYNHLGGGGGRFDYDGESRLVGEQWRGGSLPSRDLCYHYDANGNRLARISGKTVTFSTHDAENRLLTEVAYAGSALIPDPQITASSTQEGFSTLPVTDTLTPDSLLPADAWASEVLSGTQHSVVLDFGTEKPVGRLKLWIPTGLGFAQRFKVQAWDADAFRDLEGAEVTGAKEVDGTGWYRATGHRVVFDCLAESTSRVRFLQDAGGGPSGSPDQAWLNEFQAFELTRASSKAFAYDPAGLLLSETGSGGDVNYGYDWGYRLKTYKHRGTKASYVTDVLGRRLSKTLRGSPRERYAYDGQDVIGDYAGKDLVARYTNGPGMDQKLTLSREGQSHHFVQDALGSTHQLLDASEGVATQYLFDAWGNDLGTTGSVVNRYRHGGAWLDAESGLYNHRNRVRNPLRGGWNQRDPLGPFGDPANPNAFDFVANNPVNYTDPTGRTLRVHGEFVWKGHAAIAAFGRANAGDADVLAEWMRSTREFEFRNWDEVQEAVHWWKLRPDLRWRLHMKDAEIMALVNRDNPLKNGQLAAAGVAAVSTVPGVGEAMDVYTISARESKWWQRGFAGVSLAVSVVAGGFTPNYSALLRAERAAEEGVLVAARAHSVAFETTIPKLGMGTRGAHFRVANETLAAELRTDAEFARSLENLGVKLPSRFDRSPHGWTWHHVPDRPGILQLVPRHQHQGSLWQPFLHPGGEGGFKLWGTDF